jgi:hypothetical protein
LEPALSSIISQYVGLQVALAMFMRLAATTWFCKIEIIQFLLRKLNTTGTQAC